MPVGLQDSGSDGPKRPRPAEEDREDPQPPGPEQGQVPLHRPGVQTDLRLPEGQTHHRLWLVSSFSSSTTNKEKFMVTFTSFETDVFLLDVKGA